ncbi:MAG: phage tail protein [Parvularculaceae bacterium]|nr:phage tail protein [Parvularculaceae bacterium]
MGDPFIGEIRYFAGNFAPRGWAFCNGQLLSIASNTALFSILGTTYGGDGRSTFALPDARGRVMLGTGTGPGLSPSQLGQKSGVESNALTTSNLPSHTHEVDATATMHATRRDARGDSPQGKVLADTIDGQLAYRAGKANIEMSDQAVTVDMTMSNEGGSQPANNVGPSITVNCIIALQGIFPSRS